MAFTFKDLDTGEYFTKSVRPNGKYWTTEIKYVHIWSDVKYAERYLKSGHFKDWNDDDHSINWDRNVKIIELEITEKQ